MGAPICPPDSFSNQYINVRVQSHLYNLADIFSSAHLGVVPKFECRLVLLDFYLCVFSDFLQYRRLYMGGLYLLFQIKKEVYCRVPPDFRNIRSHFLQVIVSHSACVKPCRLRRFPLSPSLLKHLDAKIKSSVICACVSA